MHYTTSARAVSGTGAAAFQYLLVTNGGHVTFVAWSPSIVIWSLFDFLLHEGIDSLIPQYVYAGGILWTIREFLRLLKLVLNHMMSSISKCELFLLPAN